jgi:hypothetical protein
VLQAAVDRFGWTVAGAGPVEVGQYLSGSPGKSGVAKSFDVYCRPLYGKSSGPQWGNFCGRAQRQSGTRRRGST